MKILNCMPWWNAADNTFGGWVWPKFHHSSLRSSWWNIGQTQPPHALSRAFHHGIQFNIPSFQAAMDRNFEGLSGVISIADDIAVVGKDQADHDRNLHALMTRAQEWGIVFNQKKCHIKTDRIIFFGNGYNNTGIHPDPAKVQAILDLTPPTIAA